MKKGLFGKILIATMALFIVCFVFTACELSEPADASKYYINDNEYNDLNKNQSTKNDAIDNVTDGIDNLRAYLDGADATTTGYYMGVEFNIDTRNPNTLEGSNFRLKIQAHMYTHKYEDDDGNPIIEYKDDKGRYYPTQNPEGTLHEVYAVEQHNDIIRKSDIVIEWYNGATNEVLIGMYFDGINANSDDPGNILYLNIQGAKRSFPDFGDTVLYQQLIRLLMSLSVEKLLTAGNIQGDAGTSSIRSLFEMAVADNYKVVLNDPVISTLFYGITADLIADRFTKFIQGLFKPFEDKVDPLTNKYLGFKFSVVGGAVINSIATDMQFFTQPAPGAAAKNILTGAYLTFDGAALSNNAVFNYVSDVTFEYGTYPPEDMKLDRDYYTLYEYGQYEFTGNLYIPLLNANYDALIRTDMQQYDNSTNNVFMEYRDIANGELMIGGYYRYENTYVDITGLEYLYGWIDLNYLGFPKVRDDSLNLADGLAAMFRGINNGIVSIVDAILSPDKNDKENHLLEEIMKKTSMTEKTPDDIFSINSETLLVDMVLIKAFLFETGQGSFTTRDIINILDSMLPYTMDQIAILLGVANAEIMLDNTYFTFTLNVDTNEITIRMFTNVGRDDNEGSLLIFQLELTPVWIGRKVNIADVDFSGFKRLEQIYTYSATMNGHFIFSSAETVDLSKLLSSMIGENSGLNTQYTLPPDAGITFKLVYDQFVTDFYEKKDKEYVLDADGNRIFHKAGRSAFTLEVFITGTETESGDDDDRNATDWGKDNDMTKQVIVRLASDDVAFNSDVYDDQPTRVGELGYIWVSIECVKQNGTQKIPKVKIREDVFMSSMQAYLNGTSISDDAAELGKNEVNLSITSIIFALVEDSYVVMEPKQMEITSSNETLQSIFRVRGLIGNISVNAGFTQRVKGLAGSRNDYGMYKVGQFENMLNENNPYETVLHDKIPVYFYEDYRNVYPEYDGGYVKVSEATEEQKSSYYGQTKYYYEFATKQYVVASEAGDNLSIYECTYDEEGTAIPVEYIFGGWEQLYDLRVDKEKGYIQVYKYGGKVTVTREEIEIESGSFFAKEDQNNQDVTQVKFLLKSLPFIFRNAKGEYLYKNYNGDDTVIDSKYIFTEEGAYYVKYLGIQDILYHAGEKNYYYYDANFALKDKETGENLIVPVSQPKDFLFEYDAESVKITEDAKKQYAPRINGSFMGNIRRYIVVFNTVYRQELGKIIELTADPDKDFYCKADKENKIIIYNEDGLEKDTVSDPIVLFVMEPCMGIPETVSVQVQVNEQVYSTAGFDFKFDIDWDLVTVKGTMVMTRVTIAPGTMGEISFPVRIIVTNREIVSLGKVSVYETESDVRTANVPVVDVITIDPYDYLLAKAEYFIMGNKQENNDEITYLPNYYPNDDNFDETSDQYLAGYKKAEENFINWYFSKKPVNINFDYRTSNLYGAVVIDQNGAVWDEEGKEIPDPDIGKYIVMSYSNKKGTAYMQVETAKDPEEGEENGGEEPTTPDTDTDDTFDTIFAWSFDKYKDGQYTESKITTVAPSGSAYTTLYLHTYYKGQLIALQVNIKQMTLYGVKFGEFDKFDPIKDNTVGSGNDAVELKPGDKSYVYGHYIANIFKEDTKYISTNPTFLFLDGEGRTVKKTFDSIVYINPDKPFKNNKGEYSLVDFALAWGDPEITNIGQDGSYAYEDGVYKNLPFYIRKEDDNGEPYLEATANGSDITSASINWYSMFAVYSRSIGKNGEEIIRRIPLIAGDATNNGFMTSVIRITVECPKLEVAETESPNGGAVEVADDLNDGYLFKLSKVNTGNEDILGYYFIDPLRAETLYLPNSVVIWFSDTKSDRQIEDSYDNVEWFATLKNGEMSLINEKDIEILRLENGRYKFIPSTETPMYTKVMARIGNNVSGYEYITVCLNVLSKDPQEIEFFVGNINSGDKGKKISNIERSEVSYSQGQDGNARIIYYTYYVKTFDAESFNLPNYIKAGFGDVGNLRYEFYNVEWQREDGNAPMFEPDSIQTLVAQIGTGDVSIKVYLSIVVANQTVKKISVTSDDIKNYYVRVGDIGEDTFRKIGDLFTVDYDEKTVGLYTDDGKYILISTGESYDDIPAGKIGLYTYDTVKNGYVPRENMYLYDFIKYVFGSFSISFGDDKNMDDPVDVWDLTKLYFAVSADGTKNNYIGRVGVWETASIGYAYDNVTGDRITVNYEYRYDGQKYYPYFENGFATVYKGNTAQSAKEMGKYTIEELTYMISVWYLSQDIRSDVISRIVISEQEKLDLRGKGKTLKSILDDSAIGIAFKHPDKNEKLTFSAIEFEGGSTLSYTEICYRVAYLKAHRERFSSDTVVKNVAISNFDGIFNMSDIVRPYGKRSSFKESTAYNIELGAGAGAYTLRARLVFDGGVTITEMGTGTGKTVIDIMPYDRSGNAQYGDNGYLFGEQISATLEVRINNGFSNDEGVQYINYGPNFGVSAPRLTSWYVKEYTGLSEGLSEGIFIDKLTQSVIYDGRNDTKVLTASALAPIGFRIERDFKFSGYPLDTYTYNTDDSMAKFSGNFGVGMNELSIVGGVVEINDVYKYPISEYFETAEYLPDAIKLRIGNSEVTVYNVKWDMDEDGVNTLLDCKFTGTDGNKKVATAKILGWESVDQDGHRIRHNASTVELAVNVKSARITEILWNGGTLKLDTTAVKDEEGERQFFVEADAFNDSDSSAMKNNVFTLPTDLNVKYECGTEHVFSPVSYVLGAGVYQFTVASIPYDNNGVRPDLLRQSLIALGQDVPEGWLSQFGNCIPLEVTVSSGSDSKKDQTIIINVRFYDKTIQTATALIQLSDENIRNSILSAIASTGTDKSSELYNQLNQTRIRVNLENIYAAAVEVINGITLPTYSELKAVYDDHKVDVSSVRMAAMTGKLTSGWKITTPTLVYDAQNNIIWQHPLIRETDIYSATKISNFVNERCWYYVNNNSQYTAESLINAFNSNLNETTIKNILNNYTVNVLNAAYRYLLTEYMQVEFSDLFGNDLATYEKDELNYMIGYKNRLESNFDYDVAIREIYRIKDIATGTEYGLPSDPKREENIRKACYNALIAVADDAIKKTDVALASSVSETLREKTAALFLKNFQMRINMILSEISYVITGAPDGQTAPTKQSLRKMLSECITTAFDFTSDENYFNDVKGFIIEDTLASVNGYADIITTLCRYLGAGSSINGMLNTLILRTVNNYTNTVYMEGKVAIEIKKLQRMNLKSGYYYIDPYYNYVALPSRIIVDFDEYTGGFAYTTYVNWDQSVQVTYKGNAINEAYGYVAVWNEFMNSDDSVISVVQTNALQSFDNNLTWAQIKAMRGDINTILLELEKDQFAKDHLTEERYEELDTKDKRSIELYKYYLMGKYLKEKQDFAGSTIKQEDVDFVFDSAVYGKITATVKAQSVSMLSIIKKREFISEQLEIYQDEHATSPMTEKIVDDPFAYTQKDLPSKVKMPDDNSFVDIYWTDADISPEGNLGSEDQEIVGYIKNTSGQQIRMKLYVYRWEYAGIAKNKPIGTDAEGNLIYKTMNPLNFYFSENLVYSSEDSYRIYFNKYGVKRDNNGDLVDDFKYESVLFYPEDSRLLVSGTNDSDMINAAKNAKYMMYWDIDALSRARREPGVEKYSGNVSIGNASMGQKTVASLTDKENARVPWYGTYIYEELSLLSIAFEQDATSGEDLYGIDGNVIAVTAPDMNLPNTAKIKVNQKNINYLTEGVTDYNDLFEVKVLWNKSYYSALNDLVDFITIMMPTSEVEPSMRIQYATNIIMNYSSFEAARQESLLQKAIAYYKNIYNLPEDSEATPKIIRDAKQLLMFEEKYNFAQNEIFFSGGGTTKNVTLLVQYKGSSYIKEIPYRVRLIFGDYTIFDYCGVGNSPAGGATSSITPISVADIGNTNKLYIGVRGDYWNENEGTSTYDNPRTGAYTVEKNTKSPYDNVNESIYKLAEKIFGGNIRYVLVTDIVFQTEEIPAEEEDVNPDFVDSDGKKWKYVVRDGCFVSKSFVIDGVTYESDLLKVEKEKEIQSN